MSRDDALGAFVALVVGAWWVCTLRCGRERLRQRRRYAQRFGRAGRSSSAPSGCLTFPAFWLGGVGSVNSWICVRARQRQWQRWLQRVLGLLLRWTARSSWFGPLAGTKKACSGPAVGSVAQGDYGARSCSHLRDQGLDVPREGRRRSDGAEPRRRHARRGGQLDGDLGPLQRRDPQRGGGHRPDSGLLGRRHDQRQHGVQQLPRRLHARWPSCRAPPPATKEACPTKEATQQEGGYLAALESAVRIEQAGPELTLLNSKGQKTVTLMR